MVRVQVKQGWLRGEERELATGGGKIFSFKGIPYAQPPVGDLRFKAPRPPISWEGERDATKYGAVCPQFDFIITKGIRPDASEDCLFVNVFTPEMKPNKLLPVMFLIHAGAFKIGSGNDELYGPDLLVAKEIVLVTINYRLEALGFLCLDTPDVPGNAGMKDQIMALKWVQENIMSFGGDPNNVTIFGISAGGASVSYHLTSPMSQGLFRRAIIQSGAFTCDWANGYRSRDRAFCLGKRLGITTNDTDELLAYLQELPFEKLVDIKAPITLKERIDVGIDVVFNVVKEKIFPGVEAFMTNDVEINLKMMKDTEIMIGHTTHEGIVFVQKLEQQTDLLDSVLEYCIPLELARHTTLQQQEEIGKQIHDKYFNGEIITAENADALVKFYSFQGFVYNIRRFLKSFKTHNKSNAYFYQFSCMSERNISASLLNPYNLKGVSHGDDIMYLFNIPVLPINKSFDSYKMIQRATSLWTNFAKFGNPTPNDELGVRWAPYTLEEEEYLDIGERLVPGTHLHASDIDFWDDIYEIVYLKKHGQ